MTAKFDWSQYEEDSPKEGSNFDWSNYESQPSKLHSVTAAPFKGALKNYQAATAPWQPRGPVSASLAKRVLDKFLPTRDEPAEKFLERAGGIVPAAALGAEGLGQKALQVAGGTVAGELAQAMGLDETGQSISEAVGMGIPGIIQAAKKGISSTPARTLPSGLTKPKAVEAPKISKLALMSEKRQKSMVEGLNKEASELTAKSLKKHLPISEEIKKGVDFEGKFKKNFSELESQANKYNPEIDVTPLSDFMDAATKKFAGIPKELFPKGLKNISSDVKAFRKRPITSLKNLLKIYRINNDKRSQIYETALVKGKQTKYSNFLKEFNDAIRDSISKTLPQDSAWVKGFLENNKQYSNFLNAKKTERLLQPFLSGKPTPQKMEALISNPDVKKRLAISMGEEGAKEVSQIAQDLKTATQAIKNIPKGALDKFDAVFPLYFLIPWAGKFIGGYKSVQVARHAYGWLLSRPEGRKWTREALKSISSQDLEGYKKASIHLLNEMNQSED